MLRNSGYIAASRAVAGVAGLVTLALTGRALGVVLFGVLVLVNSYALTISGFAKFQSWQLVVRYGGRALSGGEAAEFRQGVAFAIGLDLAGGIGGMVVGIALIPLLAPKFGVPQQFIGATMVYCALLPMMVSTTADGVLRSLDRFDLIAWQGTITPLTRAILTTFAWAADARFEMFLSIWFITYAVAKLCLWFLAWRELHRRRLLGGIRPTLRSGSLIGAWRFALNVNFNTALVAVSGPMAHLLVGALLGPVGAGLYRAASVIGNAIQKPASLLAKSFYPEVVRLDVRSKAPWMLMLQSAVLASAVAVPAILALILVGRAFIGFIFGPDFVGAYEPLLVLLVVTLLGTISFPVPWMLYALDLPHTPVIARLVGTIVYLATVAPLCWSLGVIGAAGAFALGNAARVIVMTIVLVREYRRPWGDTVPTAAE